MTFIIINILKSSTKKNLILIIFYLINKFLKNKKLII